MVFKKESTKGFAVRAALVLAVAVFVYILLACLELDIETPDAPALPDPGMTAAPPVHRPIAPSPAPAPDAEISTSEITGAACLLHVIDEDGKGIPGAKARLLAGNVPTLPRLTDTEGRCRLGVSPDMDATQRVLVTHPEYVAQVRFVKAGGDEHTMTLRRGHVASCRVRRRTGGPLPNATVFLSRAALPAAPLMAKATPTDGLLRIGESPKEWIHVAMSGDDGIARLPALPEGEWLVTAARATSVPLGHFPDRWLIPGDLPEIVFADPWAVRFESEERVLSVNRSLKGLVTYDTPSVVDALAPLQSTDREHVAGKGLVATVPNQEPGAEAVPVTLFVVLDKSGTQSLSLTARPLSANAPAEKPALAPLHEEHPGYGELVLALDEGEGAHPFPPPLGCIDAGDRAAQSFRPLEPGKPIRVPAGRYRVRPMNPAYAKHVPPVEIDVPAGASATATLRPRASFGRVKIVITDGAGFVHHPLVRITDGTATWDMHCEKDLWVPAGRNLQLSAELPGYQPLRTTFNVDPGNGTPSIVELLLQVAP